MNFNIYDKSSIRSRPCISLDPKFPRLLLEVIQKMQLLEQKFFDWDDKGPLRTPKMSKKVWIG